MRGDPHWLEMVVVDAALRVELGETLQALAAECGMTPLALGRCVRQWHEARDEAARLARDWQRVERVLAALPPPPAPVPSPPRAPPPPLPPWQSEPPFRTLPQPQTQLYVSPAAVAAPGIVIKSESVLASTNQLPGTSARMAQRHPAARRHKFTDEQLERLYETEGRWFGDTTEDEDEAYASDQTDNTEYESERQYRRRCRCRCGRSLYGARRPVNRHQRGRHRLCAVAGCSNPVDPN